MATLVPPSPTAHQFHHGGHLPADTIRHRPQGDAVMTAPTTVSMPPPVDPIRLGLLARSTDSHLQALARAASDDFPAWVDHVRPAASCTRPIRLAGAMTR